MTFCCLVISLLVFDIILSPHHATTLLILIQMQKGKGFKCSPDLDAWLTHLSGPWLPLWTTCWLCACMFMIMRSAAWCLVSPCPAGIHGWCRSDSTVMVMLTRGQPDRSHCSFCFINNTRNATSASGPTSVLTDASHQWSRIRPRRLTTKARAVMM